MGGRRGFAVLPTDTVMKIIFSALIILATSEAVICANGDGNKAQKREIPEIVTKIGVPLMNLITAPWKWLASFFARWKKEPATVTPQTESTTPEESIETDDGSVIDESSVITDNSDDDDIPKSQEQDITHSAHDSLQKSPFSSPHLSPHASSHETPTSQPCMAALKMATFKAELLHLHNKKRSEHQAKDLDPSLRLQQVAQKWAEQYADVVGKHGGHLYPDDQQFGENVFIDLNGKIPTAEEVINKWYSESQTYKYETPDESCCEHFTQMVWNDTQKAGFGCAMKPNGPVFVVAVYEKAGNIPSKFRDNVKEPQKEDDAEEDKINHVEMPKYPCMPPKEMDEFREELRLSNNKIRILHHARELEPAAHLNVAAQALADDIAGGKEYDFHGCVTEYGANIFVAHHRKGMNPPATANEVMNVWYNEQQLYIYDNPVDCCHRFTQMVWKSSEEVGYGCSRLADSGKVFIVAMYDKCGNDTVLFKGNVGHPKAHAANINIDRPDENPRHPCMSSAEMTHFRKELFRLNNEKRALHHAKDLKMSPYLHIAAQAFADSILDGEKYQLYQCEFYGESVFVTMSPEGGLRPAIAEKVIEEWYSDASLYRYSKQYSCCQRFTQMVWKGNIEVGFGCAVSLGSGMAFIVATFSECGNDASLFNERISRPEVSYKIPISTPEYPCFDSDSTLAQFRVEILRLHNKKRKLHGADDLNASEALTRVAQILATRNADLGTYQSASPIYAENEFIESGRLGLNAVTAKEVIERWYAESEKYDYEHLSYNCCGHFVQMVWKAAKEVGFGCAKSSDDTVYVIAVYNTAPDEEDYESNVSELVSE